MQLDQTVRTLRLSFVFLCEQTLKMEMKMTTTMPKNTWNTLLTCVREE